MSTTVYPTVTLYFQTRLQYIFSSTKIQKCRICNYFFRFTMCKTILIHQHCSFSERVVLNTHIKRDDYQAHCCDKRGIKTFLLWIVNSTTSSCAIDRANSGYACSVNTKWTMISLKCTFM